MRQNKAIHILTGAGLGAGIGAAVMFLLDPASGRRRRALIRDKAVSTWNDTNDTVRRRGRDIANRARGVAASTRSVFRHESVPGDILKERIRAKIGRMVSHPGAIEITAGGGIVTLSGPVLAGEMDGLLKAVSGIKGVERVVNGLTVMASA